MHRMILLAALAAFAGTAAAKLPAPSEEAKAKAAEATAKTAWTDKVAAYKLCQVQDRVAAKYHADMKAAGKETKPSGTPPACTDPGPFVYTPTGATGMTPQGNTPAATTGAAPTPAPGAAPAAPAASAPASAAKS
jgi:hypothetical protein